MYSPYLYPYNQQPQIQGVKFVHGRAEAENCMLPFNSKALLMDIDRDFFYLKSTDANGISSISEYSFQKVEPQTQPTEGEYITKADFEKWRADYESTISKLITQQQQSNQSATGVRKNTKSATSTRKSQSAA